MELKVLPLGAVFKYNGVRLRVVARVQECRGCYFNRYAVCPTSIVGACSLPWRDEEIIFRKFDVNRKENLHGYKGKNNKSY